jgi:sugar (pentulose or hexulose) kinase
MEHEDGGADPAGLFDEVLAAGDEPTGVIVLPYLSGRQAPAPDPAARLRVLGRQPAHGPADLAKALLEGLCLQTRWMLAEQVRLAGGPAEPTVHLFGGPVAANPAWVQLKARVLPGALRVVREAEPVAAGAAIVAAVRSGCAPPSVLAGRFMPGAGAAYDVMFSRFVAAATSTEGEAP